MLFYSTVLLNCFTRFCVFFNVSHGLLLYFFFLLSVYVYLYKRENCMGFCFICDRAVAMCHWNRESTTWMKITKRFGLGQNKNRKQLDKLKGIGGKCFFSSSFSWVVVLGEWEYWRTPIEWMKKELLLVVVPDCFSSVVKIILFGFCL